MQPKRMNDNKIYAQIFIIIVALSGLSLGTVHAKTTLSFEQWKARQERIDQSLMQAQPSPTVQTSRSHGLLSTNTSAQVPNDSRASSQSSTTQQHSQSSQQPRPQQLGTQVSININQATAQEITAKLDSIGPKKARAIIQYRQQHGDFKRIDDLLEVKGIGEKILAKNRDRIRLKP